MKKIVSTKTLGVAFALTTLHFPTQAFAQTSIQQQINELRQQINVLQKQQELGSDNNKSANVQLNNSGLTVLSADKEFGFRIKAFAQLDSRNYIQPTTQQADQFIVRTSRLVLDGKYPGNFLSRIVFDFGGSSSQLVDGYVNWKANDFFNIRVGKFKGPVGLERAKSTTALTFIERGLTNSLVSNRDIGVGLSGAIIPKILEYRLLLSNGTADSISSNGDVGTGKDASAKISAHPFKNTDIAWLHGFGVAIAGSAGKRDGTTTNTELASYRTTAQNTAFSYATGSFAKGNASRINPQAWYYLGSFGIFGEYIASSNDVHNGASKANLKNTAWNTTISYLLTGENASFRSIKPKANFDPKKDSWGAFEIAARIGELNIDKKTFPTFANKATSVSKIEEKVLGLNWYLNQNIRLSLNYVHNDFKGGTTTGNKDSEKAVLSRLEFKF